MKTINFNEFQPTWIKYSSRLEVTDEEAKQLENGETDLEELLSKYEYDYEFYDSEDCDTLSNVNTKYELDFIEEVA
jgi:molybdopterin-guanine dinucleotide biosynthesis protein A